jgi:hypothetical protein
MDARRTALLAAGLVVAVVLFLVLRPGGDDEETAGNPTTDVTTAVTLTAETETATTAPPPPPLPAPEAAVVRISVAGGVPEGGIRGITVEEGRQVTLVVTSDVADHVHVHGIDELVDVGPGLPGRLTFTASPAGRFEVELEERGVQIADLKIQP